MKKLFIKIVIFLLFFMCACSKNQHEIKDTVFQHTVFNREFSLVKPYSEFKNQLQLQVQHNEQQEIERNIKINQPIEIKQQKEESNSSDQESFYTNIQIIDVPIKTDVLINKQNKLPKNYIPENLVRLDLPQLDDRKHYLTDVAYQALKELIGEAYENNHNIVIVSAYRSYQSQKDIYNRYVKRSGKRTADTYSARPGHSEHQSGLAVDVSTKSLNGSLTQKFASTPEGLWVSQNAHLFGFIIRYPINKSHITGYIYEPWHLRYVGVDIAVNIHQCQCTFEEYLQ